MSNLKIRIIVVLALIAGSVWILFPRRVAETRLSKDGEVMIDSVTNNTVINSVYDGIAFSTSTGTLLQNNTVTSPWRNGIVISPPFYPAPTGSATITGNTVTGLAAGATAYLNNSSGFAASLSGNSWQGGTGPTEGPYGGTPAAVPGTVQAENYDTGGQGLGYSVSSVNGSGNGYRADGVNLEATSDTGGGYDVGWTASAQWFRYTVNVAAAGTYTVSMRVAAPSAVTDAFHLANAAGTNLSGNVNIPSTGGWQTWATVTATVTLPAGVQVLTLDEDNGGWNINNAQFTTTGGGSASLSASPTSLSFASQNIGTTSTGQTTTIHNTGTVSASVSSIATSGNFTQTNTCGTTIPAAGSCTVNVTFTPTATGTRTGTLTVTSTATNNPTTVALSGTGAGAAVNLAAGKTTSESSHTDVYASTNVTDSNQNSYWESANNTFPQWVQVDLGSTQPADRVVLQLPASWGTRNQTLTVSASTDGTIFTTMAASATHTFNPTTNNTATITFTTTTQRYWRITITTNTGWPAGQLSELQIWNN